MIRNLFALIGLLAIILLAVVFFKVQGTLSHFDPKAGEVYLEMMESIIKTRNPAAATIWSVPVEEGLSADDVDQTMKMVANELNMSFVGELPTSKDIEAKSGKPYRLVKIYMFCNSLVAAQMIDYSDAFAAYMPCRITLVEDKTGKLWLIALNMDLMIYGGEPLAPDLKKVAEQVKDNMLEIMNRGAKGEF
ncbi:MAG: DUF302 domain-containing protein [Gammaproteobacteria bacterium SHHR-1]|uniref:DUF302 domain-containing protein n=1 Tax=Magnetovirga frankeli TaxID=947516 RepID=UPI0012937E35|nr:DUF302 domain-containing protein [gamma proteobacterium SS-5]